MAIGPTIETERLILRPPRAEDFDSWCAFHADEEVMRHLGGVQGPELTWRSMCAMTGAWTIEGFSMFSVIEKARGARAMRARALQLRWTMPWTFWAGMR